MEAIDKFVEAYQLQENEIVIVSTYNNKPRLFYDRSGKPLLDNETYYQAGGELFIYPLGLTSNDFIKLQKEFVDESD